MEAYGLSYLAITSFNMTLAHVVAIWSGTANNSIHLGKWSVTSGMYWFHLGVSGREPRMSVANLSNRAPTGIVPRHVWGFWGGSLQRHMCCISLPIGLSPLIPQRSVGWLIPMFSICPSAHLRGTHTSGTLSHLWVSLALWTSDGLQSHPFCEISRKELLHSGVMRSSTASSVMWLGLMLSLLVQRVSFVSLGNLLSDFYLNAPAASSTSPSLIMAMTRVFFLEGVLLTATGITSSLVISPSVMSCSTKPLSWLSWHWWFHLANSLVCFHALGLRMDLYCRTITFVDKAFSRA